MRYFILILCLLKFHVDAADWLNRTARVDLIVNPRAINTKYDILDRQERILSGVNATNGQYPWSIYTTAWSNQGSGLYFGVSCSGSIISENFALTDFHCVGQQFDPPASSIEALFGSVLFLYPLTPTGFVRSYWHIQPSIENRPSIVLLRLHESLIFNPNIQPIRLPSHENFLYEDWVSYILGFYSPAAYTEQLQSANANIRNNNLCNFSGYTADHEICANEGSPPNNGSLIRLNGFTGGAWLVYEYTRGFEFIPVLVGIHQYQYTNQTGSFGLATRVSHFVEWIEQLISEN